jgi:hypothetical protein
MEIFRISIVSISCSTYHNGNILSALTCPLDVNIKCSVIAVVFEFEGLKVDGIRRVIRTGAEAIVIESPTGRCSVGKKLKRMESNGWCLPPNLESHGVKKAEIG